MDPGRAAGRALLKIYWVRVGHEEFEVGMDETDRVLAVTLAGTTRRVELAEVVPAHYTLIVDGVSHRLSVQGHAGPWVLTIDGRTQVAEVARTRTAAAGGGPGGAPARSQEVRAPMPGLLVAVEVGEGAQVAIGQPVAIMEAMKMQMEIRSPRAGTVRRVHVAPGQELTAGQLVVTVE